MTLAWRMLLRDWRAGELRVLALALVIAVASVTSVGFFADRVKNALTRDAHQLLGGDLVIASDQPISAALLEEARVRGLRSAQTTSFISMARAGENAQLAAIKSVTAGYPLRGQVKIATAIGAADTVARAGPAVGTVWVDERFVAALSVKPGDDLELGDARLKIAAILTLEPDRGVSFFNLSPRIIMNADDIARTGLIQVGSRVTYQLLVAAAGEDRAPVQQFEQAVKPKLERGQSVQGLDNARPEIRQALDRSQQFLGLTALLAVILAAVAVALATRRYVSRHIDGYAVMRSFGARQAQLIRLFAAEFILLGVMACVVGCLVGLGAQAVIGLALAQLLQAALPWPSLIPAVQGIITGLVLLLGFALPPLLQLARVPALRVLRRDLGAPKVSAIGGYLVGLSALAGLLVWQAGDVKLGLIVLGGFAAAFVAFAALSFVALRALAATSGWGGLAWRHGLANLRRRSGASTVQILALSLGLTAILLLGFTRGDLVEAWRSKTPANAPNRFILNIQPEQRAPIATFFKESQLAQPAVYPMVRGRLVAVNDRAIGGDSYEDTRTKRLVEREFNLSFMTDLPAHNRVVDGRWFDGAGGNEAGISLEEGIAKSLNVQLGDRLTYEIAGQRFTAPISSLRKLDWDSMQVNFFVITPPKVLAEFPTSYITSFNLPVSASPAMVKLSQQFPNLTIVDMSAILAQALNVMEQVIRAVQFVFLFALVAGVLVLYAALVATQDERLQEAALMRALGASRAQVARANRVEFLTVGLLAGFLAAAASSGIGALLARQVFQLNYSIDPWVFVAGPILGLLCVGYNAWSGTRAAVRVPPIVALREA